MGANVKINHRLDQVERRLDPLPDGQVIVCFCATRAGRVSVEGHDATCPALLATDRDTVILVEYDDARTN